MLSILINFRPREPNRNLGNQISLQLVLFSAPGTQISQLLSRFCPAHEPAQVCKCVYYNLKIIYQIVLRWGRPAYTRLPYGHKVLAAEKNQKIKNTIKKSRSA